MFDQLTEDLKALMGQVFTIVDPFCGCMGDQNIKPTMKEQRKNQFAHPFFSFLSRCTG